MRRDPNLSEAFEAMVAVLCEVRREMGRLAAMELGGQERPALQRVCALAWPAIAEKWAALRDARDTGTWSTAELAVLIATLTADLVALREVLAGRLVLTDPRTN